MIRKLHIEGFKAFKDQDIPLSNLTLLAGLNNSGKSTCIQSIRIFISAKEGDSNPLLSGHGTVSDLRSDFVAPHSNVKVSLSFEDSTSSTMVLTDHNVTSPEKAPLLIYVGADRLGPQSSLPVNLSLDARPIVGDRGEYVIDFIRKLVEQRYIIPESIVHESSEGQAFEYVLQAWLREIAPGVKFSYSTTPQADLSHATIDNFRPANVGFGLSYTLPIIAATLGACAVQPDEGPIDDWVEKWEKDKEENGSLLIIENPEAHLHPQGQTAMGRLLALAAQSGVQILVETHSEHVMDGIRIAIKEGQLHHTKAKFLYFRKNADNTPVVDSPNISSNGKLDFWPEGFFDQTLRNRAQLAKR